MGVSGAALASVLGAVVGLALMLFLLFFLLRDGEELMHRAMRLVPMAEDRKAALLDHLSAARVLVLGMLLTAVAQGALLGIGFAIVGLAFLVVFGVLTALASAVPFVGTALVRVSWGPRAARSGTGLGRALPGRLVARLGHLRDLRHQAARRLGPCWSPLSSPSSSGS